MRCVSHAMYEDGTSCKRIITQHNTKVRMEKNENSSSSTCHAVRRKKGRKKKYKYKLDNIKEEEEK